MKKCYKYNMPDPTISVQDMHEYGYLWDGMLPLNSENAERLFTKNLEIFRIYSDNTEAAVIDFADLQEHARNNGLFGIEKVVWQALCECGAIK